MIIKIIFNNNSSVLYGGGIYISDNYFILLKKCQIKGNTSNSAGGGICKSNK